MNVGEQMANELVKQAWAQGARLSVSGNRLVVKGKVDDRLRLSLRSCEAAVVRMLRGGKCSENDQAKGTGHAAGRVWC